MKSNIDDLVKELREAQNALRELNGDICKVELDQNDPGSIENAIQHINHAIDNRVGRYSNNPIVGKLIESTKEIYRQAIIDKAAAYRLDVEGKEMSNDL